MTSQQPVSKSATAESLRQDSERAALRSGFFLLDSCIRVDNSEVSSWAVMANLYPLKLRLKEARRVI